ncbi:hypothetical protein B7494_g1296 [Chlorociboria aeruginascens]|nr:hypothetical protein B7494_g1296 [Chlorociboria aeruginascens]
MTKTIIFGPTGAVGSATARAAQEHGAEVILAMRDTSKPIRGLNTPQEAAGGYQRVKADLTDAASIRAAVSTTGAKHAFLYLAHGSPDHMRSSIEALKAGGVEFVVFLSSYWVVGDLHSIGPQDLIAWIHAQVELNLEAVFGITGYVAARPAYFASNVLQAKSMAATGEVKLLYPDAKFDYIAPEDIGRVCGAIVAGGLAATGGKNAVPLNGPTLLAQREVWAIVEKVLGKKIKIVEVDEQVALKVFIEESHVPAPLAPELVKALVGRFKGDDGRYLAGKYEEDVKNIEKYGGKKPTSFEEWVVENKNAFGV